MDDLTIDYSTEHRPTFVEDHAGNGWSAVDHGPRTSKEQYMTEREQEVQADYAVRLQERLGHSTQNHRLHPDAADALADQLKAAARAARERMAIDDAANVVAQRSDLDTPDPAYFAPHPLVAPQGLTDVTGEAL